MSTTRKERKTREGIAAMLEAWVYELVYELAKH